MLKTEYIVVIPMNLHNHKWYALEQDSKSFKTWSTRVNPWLWNPALILHFTSWMILFLYKLYHFQKSSGKRRKEPIDYVNTISISYWLYKACSSWFTFPHCM